MAESEPIETSTTISMRKDKRTTGHVRRLARSMQSMGMISFSGDRLQAFRNLGIEIDPAAMVRDSRAGAMVAQQCLLDVLVDLKRIYDAASDKGKVKLVPHIGYVSRSLTAANRGMVEAAGLVNSNGMPVAEAVVHTMIPMQVVNEIRLPQEGASVEVLPEERAAG